MLIIFIWPCVFFLPYFIEYQFYPNQFPFEPGILTFIWIFVSMLISFIIDALIPIDYSGPFG